MATRKPQKKTPGPSALHEEIRRYSLANKYEAKHFADPVCRCGGKLFSLRLDDTEGAAIRRCVGCHDEHPIGDSAEFLGDAELDDCECPCGSEAFELAVGLALYKGSDDVKWLYLGCRCPKCGLAAVYGDWKSEFEDYRLLLARV